jgi:hypothetical protein
MYSTYNVSVLGLRTKDPEVLSRKTSSILIRRKTSFEYHKDRLRNVLGHFIVNASVKLMAQLL